MSNDFCAVIRESIDSFDTAFTFEFSLIVRSSEVRLSSRFSFVSEPTRLDWYVVDDIILLG